MYLGSNSLRNIWHWVARSKKIKKAIKVICWNSLYKFKSYITCLKFCSDFYKTCNKKCQNDQINWLANIFKRPTGSPIGRSNMRLYTTPNGLEIWFKNCSRIELVVGWYSKTTTYDVSHMRLYAICRFKSWHNGRVAGLYNWSLSSSTLIVKHDPRYESFKRLGLNLIKLLGAYLGA